MSSGTPVASSASDVPVGESQDAKKANTNAVMLADKRLVKQSFHGIQYSTKGHPIVFFLDRAKHYLIAYAMDKGGRNQLLLHQFEFEEQARDPFTLIQPVIIDGKAAKENSVINVLIEKFDSRQIGLHLVLPEKGKTEKKKSILRHFFKMAMTKTMIVKAGSFVLEPDRWQEADAFRVEFTTSGVSVSPEGDWMLLEGYVEWVRFDTQ